MWIDFAPESPDPEDCEKQSVVRFGSPAEVEKNITAQVDQLVDSLGNRIDY